MSTKLSPAKKALLAQRLRGKAAPRAVIPRRDPTKPVPLSFSQQRLWFLVQLEPDNPFYNIPMALHLEGELDLGAFQQAVDQIVQRHETLRTTFTTVDGQPRQIIHPQMTISIETVDISDVSHSQQEERVERLAMVSDRPSAIATATTPFDLSQGPLLRIKLLRLAPSQSVLLVTLHHIISDAWSTGIFVRELAYFYQAALQSEPIRLPELPIQYADFAHWQRQQTDRLEQQLNYWQQQFTTLPPVLALPTDRPRLAVQTYRGDRCTIELSPALTANLKQLAKETDSTLFIVLLASFQVLLHRYTHQTDITVGTPIANRNQTAIEGLIGFFINSLALRADLSGNPTFKQLLAQVREQTLRAYAHQDLPFEKLVDALDIPRDLSHSPLFQVMLILQNAPTTTLDVPGLTLTPLHYDTQTTKFDLTLICIEQDENLTAVMEFNTDLFDAATIERLLGHWQTLLSGIVKHPQARISDLPLLSLDEQRQQQQWNQTQTNYLLDVPLHHWIEAQVKRSPEAIAVKLASPSCDGRLRSSSSVGSLVGDHRTLTYQQLDARANQLAHYLQSLGVGPDSLVGVSLERSLNLVIALLGILKAGGAYVPLDPDYPAERIANMVEDAQPIVTLTAGSSSLPAPCLDLDRDWEQIAQQPSTRPHPAVSPENLAYVIYTSGSTGKPKGAMNTHAAICNRLLWMQETFTLTAEDVVLQKTPFSFDVSVWEFFWPLMTGARLVMAAPGGHRDSQYLSACIQAEQVTTIHFVPAMLSAFLDAPEVEQCTSLRTVIASGEALPVSVQQRFEQRLSAQLHNLYGPTEAAIDVSHWPCQRGDSQLSVPLGYAIANIQLHVLDRYLNPVPTGVTGELHIGGIGLARGYLNRPGLTAERFIPDPFCDRIGARLYKTGDLVRYLPSGALEFLGRIDHQVKLRGLRIELGEIEANLLQHPHLKEAVVTVQTAPSGAQQLVAYGVAEPELTLADLQAWLQPKLPDYMVPSIYVPLEQLPLSPNGKVDRRALIPPELGVHEYSSPRTAAEQTLAGIWSQLLHVENIGIDDNFFELGGDSILSLQVVSRAVQLGLQITPKQLFHHQTIRSLAQVAGTVLAITAEQVVSGDSPLLPIQHWFFEQSLPNPEHWNQAVLLRVPQSLTFEELCQCVGQLMAHHDGLRSQFPHSTQIIPAAIDEVPCQEIDLTALPTHEQTTALTESATRIQASLSFSAVIQVALFRLSGDTNRLLITAHHLVIDGLSWRILLEDFQTLLQHQPLPPKTCSIRQWHEQLLHYDAKPDQDYWQQQAPHHPLPVDFPNGSNTYAYRTTHSIQLSESETAQLRAVPQAYRVQVNDLMVTALVLVVAQWSNQTQLRIDFEGHGRADLGLDISRTVGWFTTLYPMQFDLASITELESALKTVKEQLRQVPDQGLSYGILRYLHRDQALQSQLPAPIRFNYLGQFQADEWLAPEPVGPLRGPTNPCSHSLTVDIEIAADQLQVRFRYSQAQYRSATVEQLAEGFGVELRSLIQHCLQSDTHGYTPSDFSLAKIQQPQLDQLVAARGGITDLYPLSPTQQGILFHSLYAPNEGLYVSQFSYTLKGPLNTEALQQAWASTIAQHPALRTAFVWEGLDQPFQYVQPECELPWTAIDLTASNSPTKHLSNDQSPPQVGDLGGQRTDTASHPPSSEQSLSAILYEDRVKGFALDQAPLMRLQLVRLSEDTHELLWSFHHIILDGWSLPIVLQSVFQQYSAIENQRPFDIPKPRPYRDYIQWLSDQDQGQAHQFWQQLLQGFTTPTPLGGKTDAQGSRADREHGYTCIEHHLSTEVATALENFCNQHHLTLNTLTQGAWAILLSRVNNCTDVVFGATTSGRPPELIGADQIVGVLINTLPVRVQIEPERSLLNWLQTLQEQQSAARQYEYCSLAQIQQLSAIPQGTPLFESLVVFENYPVDTSVLQAVQTSVQLVDFRSTANNSYPLTVRVLPGHPLKLDMMVDLTRFPAAQVQDWLLQLAAILQFMTQQSTTVGEVLAHLDAVSQAQQTQQRQSLQTTSINKLKRTRRRAVSPSGPEVQS